MLDPSGAAALTARLLCHSLIDKRLKDWMPVGRVDHLDVDRLNPDAMQTRQV